MNNALFDLEKKLGQLLELTQRLRAENQSLRSQLVVKTDETRRLSEKIAAAKNALASLLKQLPEKEGQS